MSPYVKVYIVLIFAMTAFVAGYFVYRAYFTDELNKIEERWRQWNQSVPDTVVSMNEKARRKKADILQIKLMRWFILCCTIVTLGCVIYIFYFR